jgi:hypothetical protein
MAILPVFAPVGELVIARRRFIVNFLSVREYFFREDGSHGSWFIQQIQKSPTYMSFGRKKHNDQKDSCIYSDGIAPSGLRTDTQRRQRSKASPATIRCP